MAWEKREVYVVTIHFVDEEDEDPRWEEHFADTIEQAEQMKEKFLAGEDNFYGDCIYDCTVSDTKEEREFWSWGRERGR